MGSAGRCCVWAPVPRVLEVEASVEQEARQVSWIRELEGVEGSRLTLP